jgi:hypothetical protein
VEEEKKEKVEKIQGTWERLGSRRKGERENTERR